MKVTEKNYWYLMLLLLGTICFTACDDDNDNEVTPETPEVTANVLLADNAIVGKYLTDKDGRSLYFFTKDVTGESVCEGQCIEAWPAFYEANIEVGEGLDAADFGVITREDGSKQSTFKGWPLYYFISDSNAGDLNGEGNNQVWYAAKPDYTVMVADLSIDDQDEKFLVDAAGNTLYLFTVDETDVSNCAGDCIARWPIFYSGPCSPTYLPMNCAARCRGERYRLSQNGTQSFCEAWSRFRPSSQETRFGGTPISFTP